MVNTTPVDLTVAGRRFRLEVFDGDHVSRVIAQTGSFYEREMLDDLTRRTRQGQVVVDVGAYIGNHAVFLAGVSDLYVIAIEPFSDSADLLARNTDLNHLTHRVELHRVAAGRASGKGSTVVVDEHNLGMVRVSPGKGVLEIVTVDSIVGDRDVAAIKVDVEGMEIDVLDGAIETIRRCEPLIYVEASDILAERQVGSWMEAHDYRFVRQFNETPTGLFAAVDDSLPNLYPKYLVDHGSTQAHALAELTGAVRDLRGEHYRFSREVKEYREQLRRTTSLFGEIYKRVRAASGEMAGMKANLDAIGLQLDNLRETIDRPSADGE